MSAALGTERPLPALLPIAELMWQELTAFGVVATTVDLGGSPPPEGLEQYLVRGQATALIVLGTLEQEAGLHLCERAPFRLGVGDWRPGAPLAGYTGGEDGLTPVQAASSLLVNWRMDCASGDDAGRVGRVVRSMAWVALHDSVPAACHYGFDLLEHGRALSPMAIAQGITALLGARSHTDSDGEAVARLRNGRATGSPEDWLALRPALEWFDPTRLSPQMRALEMELLERVLGAIERARAAETLDAYLLGLCSADKQVRALRHVLRWTNETVPLSLRALDSQLEEIEADDVAIQVAFELGSFPQVVDYARSIAESYRAIVGDGWEDRFWSERLLLPRVRRDDLESERVPDDWLMPSFRIAQPWAVWHSLEADAMCQRNRFLDRSASATPGDEPPLGERRAAMEEALRLASDARRRGDVAQARSRLEELVRRYPWADPVWFELAETSRVENRPDEALGCLSAALVLRPYERAFWHAIARLLLERSSEEEARIAAIVLERLPSRLPEGARQEPAAARLRDRVQRALRRGSAAG